MSPPTTNEQLHLAELSKYKERLAESLKREDLLVQENRYLRELYERSPLGYQSLDAEGHFIEINQAWLDILGYSKDEVIGQNFGDFIGHEWQQQFKENFPKFKAIGEILGFEFEMIKKDGSVLTVNLDGRIGKNSEGEFQQTYCIIKDITPQREAEKEQKKLQVQLLQSQKMESIGRLAGGIAHDFNNMLTAIIGHTELAKIHSDETQQIYSRLESIEDAAHRSAALVSQLLAFARKQTIAPQTISINKCVKDIQSMLLRLIGEDITLENKLAENLSSVRIDPTQIDQMLTNLCINARDAIEDGGTIFIETKNINFEPHYTAQNPNITTSKYVQLSVSDDGAGMDNSTLDQIFEPFFTTKHHGKGTGLGLSSVYGIVKQNNGFINTYSEKGIGTTFKIFLPCYSIAPTQQITKAEHIPQGNGENILFVEDETAILNIGQEMLTQLGYNVLIAPTPNEAIRIIKTYDATIDLLITDVVMPEMNGKQLAEQFARLIPHGKCLFTSGYTGNIIAHHGILGDDVNFLQKPFSSKDLAIAVHQVLTLK
ncbi:MAG: two-component system cell cycle sensor histidine kinase/response regulator CckA [Desulforhopalus sp.]|jgi:two-component system cell cycle sensor histidine kinase/response regulator CckA